MVPSYISSTVEYYGQRPIRMEAGAEGRQDKFGNRDKDPSGACSMPLLTRKRTVFQIHVFTLITNSKNL